MEPGGGGDGPPPAVAAAAAAAELGGGAQDGGEPAEDVYEHCVARDGHGDQPVLRRAGFPAGAAAPRTASPPSPPRGGGVLRAAENDTGGLDPRQGLTPARLPPRAAAVRCGFDFHAALHRGGAGLCPSGLTSGTPATQRSPRQWAGCPWPSSTRDRSKQPAARPTAGGSMDSARSTVTEPGQYY
eukprot:TRINITY_DN29800_c0_g2_i2.p1 TRINITY_DN29800_c0_g2~~TRINITY_DN29800_c0_g2_i2.p1  ORF type:complete len:217 (+),score=26.51 TRINITY_DN29800_c0_g2_i2:98-652(+)